MAQSQPAIPNDSHRNAPRGIVLCPLRYEQKQLCDAGIGERVDIDCCGPGREGVERWFDRHESRIREAPWLLLVGLAGAIDSSIMPGTAYVVSTVIAVSGDDCWKSPLAPQDEQTAAVVTSGKLIATRAARERMFHATGAQLVDQESAHFAVFAEQRRVRWGIVRGVSDGIDSHLPRGLEQWVDGSGRTRIGHVLRGLLCSPRDLPRLIALGRTSRRAMREAALLARRIIKHLAQPRPSC